MTADPNTVEQPDDPDTHTLDARCTCTHRYPHHHGSGYCTRCDCPAFVHTLDPVVRTPTGPPCPSCGAELLITPAGQPCGRCRRRPELTS